jgi:hypothetical protein
MADLSITAANVAQTGGEPSKKGIAADTITQGQALYKNTAGALVRCDADVLASAAFAGIALNAASSGQPVDYAPPGATVNIGATTTKNTYYVVSTTAGGIAPSADLASGDYITLLFVGNGTAIVTVLGHATGVAV